ncbi:MAG: family 20 glycosylhydrolase [Bacteroidota bacterium]|nr:family 20 glycosylhydrolase [Bacteroidota bacterium]
MRLTPGLFIGLFWFLNVSAQEISVIPRPAEIKRNTGFLIIKQPLGFISNDAPPAGDGGIQFFKDYIKEKYGIKKFVDGNTHSYGLPTEIFIDYEKGYLPREGYEITITQKDITIVGDERGLFYAFQTLIQLLPVTVSNELKIPCCTIKDYPRFAYRGMHLDVSRHFFPVSFIKKYIDYLALHKFNTFHWHLTDDQGWRIEIKKYPKLTSVGGWRNGTIIGRYPGTGNDNLKYGGFYTQEEVKEIVKYAAERYIDVIPEIEMPGHSSAAIAAYPELSCFPNESTQHPKQCAWYGDTTGKQVQQTWGVFNDVFCAGKENTFLFLQDVLDEVMALFPSKYIHAGGDECPKENWKRCPYCQQRMKDNGLNNEHELQSYFIRRMEQYLNSKGKTLIGWDEILEGGLAPNAVIMSWRGEKGGIEAARQKHMVIMTPGSPVYFDHSQTQSEDSVTIGSYNPLEKVYAYEPVPKELNDAEAKYILGAQANVWTEYMAYPSKVEYMIFPRMSALSEVLWSPKEKRDWKDFEKRLQTQFKRYDLWKANYSGAYFGLKSEILPTENNTGVLWKLSSKCSSCKINLEEIPSPEFLARDSLALALSKTEILYDQPIRFEGFVNERIIAHLIKKEKNKSDTLSSLSLKLHFNEATGKKITLTTAPSDKYPGDGAFTLVNGVQNNEGLAKSTEFIGFEGTDCEATIDLGNSTEIKEIVAHVFNEPGSWIYMPLGMVIQTSDDGNTYKEILAGKSDLVATSGIKNGYMKLNLPATKARFLKITIKNAGIIPNGNPGAGNKAWLFVDEIEVN